MTTKKVIKILVGEAFIMGKNVPVYKTAWEQEKGHFTMSTPVFVNEVEVEEDKKK
ncbi:MAG: hypothetical protein GWP19_00910 [Planctomycetia bacterium]|nr:hypothetical protein [Planctomycetia bacterium]